MWHVCPKRSCTGTYAKTINRFVNGVDLLWTSTLLNCTVLVLCIVFVSCVLKNPVWFCGIELRLCKAILMKLLVAFLVIVCECESSPWWLDSSCAAHVCYWNRDKTKPNQTYMQCCSRFPRSLHHSIDELETCGTTASLRGSNLLV
jgi:hypothetical protein